MADDDKQVGPYHSRRPSADIDAGTGKRRIGLPTAFRVAKNRNATRITQAETARIDADTVRNKAEEKLLKSHDKVVMARAGQASLQERAEAEGRRVVVESEIDVKEWSFEIDQRQEALRDRRAELLREKAQASDLQAELSKIGESPAAVTKREAERIKAERAIAEKERALRLEERSLALDIRQARAQAEASETLAELAEPKNQVVPESREQLIRRLQSKLVQEIETQKALAGVETNSVRKRMAMTNVDRLERRLQKLMDASLHDDIDEEEYRL